MKPKVLFFILFLLSSVFFLSATQPENNGFVVMRSQITSLEGFSIPEYGPFFLPLENDLSSISVNYFTAEPCRTQVFFAVEGDIDWARTEYDEVNYHSMSFRNLEEDSRYYFQIPNYSAFSGQASLFSAPYAATADFDFAFANLAEEITLSGDPRFLVLLSAEESFDETEFQAVYEMNEDVFRNTILIPLFDLEFGDESYVLSGTGLHLIQYGQVNLISVYKDEADTSKITSLMSFDESDLNFLVLGDLSTEVTEEILLTSGGLFDGVYSLNETDFYGVDVVESSALLSVTCDSDGASTFSEVSFE